MRGSGSYEMKRQRKYYIDGNTVRRMEAAPAVMRPDQDQRRVPEHVTREKGARGREREREIELRNRKRAARRNQERALRLSKSYVAFLTMAVMVFGIFAGAYIHIRSEMTARMNQISSLEPDRRSESRQRRGIQADQYERGS